MNRTSVIHVVDDDGKFRLALFRLLTAASYEVQQYSNADDFLLARLDERPGCILLDVRMKGARGLDLQKELASRGESLPIIFLTGYGDVFTAVQAMKGGAVDFLTKPVQRHTLFQSIEKALARGRQERIYRENLKRWQGCYERLTEREAEVFHGAVAGKMNKEMASELGIALRTIKAHRGQVMEKMGAHSVAELVHIAEEMRAWARQHGFAAGRWQQYEGS